MTAVHTATEARTAGEVLAWSRTLVDPALHAAVDALPTSMRRIAGYHLGWYDEQGRPALADGGKAIRPALALLAAEAVGGASTAAVPAAVAVELVHNFSLLHDDVMDGDRTRRHRPTAWTVFGQGAAILAGDALLAAAFDVLAAAPPAVARQATGMLRAAVVDLLDGQSADLRFEERPEVSVAECLAMAAAKTGALLRSAGALGALLGGGRPAQVDLLGAFGAQLGLAFQHVDDLLGIWGDPASTGKPVHSDLASRKKSLPVVAALASGTPAGGELAALYGSARTLDAAALARAAQLVDVAGGRFWSRAQADILLAQALRCLHAAGPTAKAAAELDALARLAVCRDH